MSNNVPMVIDEDPVHLDHMKDGVLWQVDVQEDIAELLIVRIKVCLETRMDITQVSHGCKGNTHLHKKKIVNTYTARPVCWREWISWQLL